MTRDDIICMAEQAFDESSFTDAEVLRFAELVIAVERDSFKQMCDLAIAQCQESMNELDETELVAKCFIQGAVNQLEKLSKAIRARGQV